MTQQEIELILSRHWASHLNMPVFLIDQEGDLLYFNEPAEAILGHRFSDIDEMTAKLWSTIFSLADGDGRLLRLSEIPLAIAWRQRKAVYRRLWLTGLDNVKRHIQTMCFPIIGQAGGFMGAIALFWELEDE